MVEDCRELEVAALLPILHGLGVPGQGSTGRPRCLVVAQSVGKVEQFMQAAAGLAGGTGIVCSVVESSKGFQVPDCDVLVTTIKLIKKLNLSMNYDDVLGNLRFLVVTEFDANMTSSEGWRSMKRVLSYPLLMSDKRTLQTLVIGYSLPDDVQEDAGQILHDYLFIRHKEVRKNVYNILRFFLQQVEFWTGEEVEETRRAEEVRRAEEAGKMEQARQAEERRRSKEVKRTEELRMMEDLRRFEEAKRRGEVERRVESQELRLVEEVRRAEEIRRTEEMVRMEEARRLEEARQVDTPLLKQL